MIFFRRRTAGMGKLDLALIGILLAVAMPLVALATLSPHATAQPLVAQVPAPSDATKVIEKAAESSWEAGLVCIVCLVAVGGLVWLLRHNQQTAREVMQAGNERERELRQRLKELEDNQRSDLRELVVAGTKAQVELSTAVEKLADTLNGRPCIAEGKHA